MWEPLPSLGGEGEKEYMKRYVRSKEGTSAIKQEEKLGMRIREEKTSSVEVVNKNADLHNRLSLLYLPPPSLPP